MKPERQSRFVLAITRAKEKMFEFQVPPEDHIAIPEGIDPQKLFFLSVAALGDYAAGIAGAEDLSEVAHPPDEGLRFGTKFFDAFVGSSLDPSLQHETTLLTAAAYYLLDQPGSSLVAAREIPEVAEDSSLERLLGWLLRSPRAEPPQLSGRFASESRTLATALRQELTAGGITTSLDQAIRELRSEVYSQGTAKELLIGDLTAAVARLRASYSSWARLPQYSGVAPSAWESAILRESFPKELWPSQRRLGDFGVFGGRSAVIQMPTSAGKSRSIEILIRSAFMSGRARVAVIVAPFRALSREISASLREAFDGESVLVNEVPDVMQFDVETQEALSAIADTGRTVLVLTPEKLLYLLRNTDGLIASLGLVVYDEGHQFDSGSRGVTYELLLTEIRALLPSTAQSLLISAVIPNARKLGEWLLGADAVIVQGDGLIPTSKAIAFASWTDRRGQLQFFEGGEYSSPDYFVPRVIEQTQLELRPNERSERHFPERSDPGAVALYLGLRLCRNGAVAVFCGRKDTASRIAALAVEVYGRGFDEHPPGEFSDTAERTKLTSLLGAHFGNESPQARAAQLGILVHHGATPHGVRLAVEFAMQKGLIRFVVCTSTLAQGVNLPIRYLIVPGLHQGGERISVRDFQNLIGRAGRAGMHREGTIIFADPHAFDYRTDRKKRWEFAASVELLNPTNAENIGSSLLGVFAPIRSRPFRGGVIVDPIALADVLLDEDGWAGWTARVLEEIPGTGLTEPALVQELRRRRALLHPLESHLMANRGAATPAEFIESAERLAAETLAYHLADDAERAGLLHLFRALAGRVASIETDAEKLSGYAKTLLGVADAQRIDSWAERLEPAIPTLTTPDAWLEVLMTLFRELIQRPIFRGIEPEGFAETLCALWTSGAPYSELIRRAGTMSATKPHGQKRRRVTDEDIAGYCEGDFGYSCGLVIAAVRQFVAQRYSAEVSSVSALSALQKRLKYGVPDSLAVGFIELGFADRVVAQLLAGVVREFGQETMDPRAACRTLRAQLREALRPMPMYFTDVLERVT